MFHTQRPNERRLLSWRPLRALVLSAFSLLSAGVAYAAPGAVLNKVISPFETGAAFGVAVDRFNRTVMAGSIFADHHLQIMVTRHNADDTLDTTFGDNGLALLGPGPLQNDAFAIAIDHQDRIVVAGLTDFGEGDLDFIVARFLDNGQLDPSFNGKGWQVIGFGADERAFALLVDFDDSIYVGGESFQGSIFGADNDDFALAKLKSNGQLDGGFGGDGKVLTGFGHNDWIQAMAFDQFHRIVAVGSSWEQGDDFATIILACYLPNGDLQQGFHHGATSFGTRYSWAYGVAIDSSNRIVVAGVASPGHQEFTNHDFFSSYHDGNFALARYNDDGTRDESFGEGGIVQNDLTGGGLDDLAHAVKIDRNGRILVAGWNRTEIFRPGDDIPTGIHHLALARYEATGALDQHFGNGGVDIIDFVIQDQLAPNGLGRAMAFDSEGRIIVAGDATGPHNPFAAYMRFDTDHPDFSVSTAASLTAPIGQSTSTGVTINSIEGFNGDVTLTLSGGPNGEPLPPGLHVSFNGVNGDTTHVQVPANGTASTTLTITVTPAVAPQQFTLFLRPAPDPAQTHIVAFTVTVVAQAGNIVPVIDAFRAAGAIDNDGIATALKAALNNAQAAADAGDIQAATQQLTGFLILVELQRGKHIKTSATIDGVPVNPVNILLADGRGAVGNLQVNAKEHPIVGYITNPAGQAFMAATVTLFDNANHPIATAVSDVSGLYRIIATSGLTPGAAYTVKVTAFPPLFKSTTPESQTFTWQSTGVALVPFVVQVSAHAP